MTGIDPKTADTTALAYLGDAVYEVYIRKYVLKKGRGPMHQINRLAVRYVCADSQAAAVKELMASAFLTEQETRLVKRARNRTNTPKPRGTTPQDYKLATGFEALIGWLYSDGQTERLEQVVREAVRIIEEEEKGGR